MWPLSRLQQKMMSHSSPQCSSGSHTRPELPCYCQSLCWSASKEHLIWCTQLLGFSSSNFLGTHLDGHSRATVPDASQQCPCNQWRARQIICFIFSSPQNKKWGGSPFWGRKETATEATLWWWTDGVTMTMPKFEICSTDAQFSITLHTAAWPRFFVHSFIQFPTTTRKKATVQ